MRTVEQKRDSFTDLRFACYKRFVEWDHPRRAPDVIPDHFGTLGRLLGYSDLDDLIIQTENDYHKLEAAVRTCKMLAGPNGWAVLKMLEARNAKI